MESIIEYTNVLPDILCDDIVEMFKDRPDNSPTQVVPPCFGNSTIYYVDTSLRKYYKTLINTYDIPKYSKEWSKIESVLYKQVLVYLNKYNMEIFNHHHKLYSTLSNDLKITNFKIQKYDNTNTLTEFIREPSRKNVVTAIIFLNQPEKGGELVFSHKTISPETGNLVIFPDEVDYIYQISPCNEDYYVITTQISTV